MNSNLNIFNRWQFIGNDLRAIAIIAFALFNFVAAEADESLEQVTHIGFISLQDESIVPLSLLDPELDVFGLPGARLANKENQTTGGFIEQNFEIHNEFIANDKDLDDAYVGLSQKGVHLIIADLPAAELMRIVEISKKDDALIFNTRAQDDTLRNQLCAPYLFHISPSRAMRADALAQYLVWKRWTKWVLVTGKHKEDKAFAEAVRRAGKRFGGKIIEEVDWTFDAGARRTDSGHVTAQQEIPAATQVKDYDVLIVADERDQFGEYLPHRTFRPRPVAGTQGLVATTWHRTHEQWGGTQLQRRFHRFADRDMTPRDYAAWAAVRAIGEAVIQTRANDPATIREFLLNDRFKLAAFKGVPLTFRDWNGQLRQPILISGPRMLVSVSPQNGFLHEYSPLDTLG